MAAGNAACGKCGKLLKMGKIEGFWTPRRESGETAARKQEKGVTLFCVRPSTSARSAGRNGRPDAEKRQAFLLLSRRFLAAFSPRRPKSLDFDHFQQFPAFAASGFSRGHLVLFRCFLPTLPYSGATSGLQASGGYTLDCVLKVEQTADTSVTGWDWRFGCAFKLCSQ